MSFLPHKKFTWADFGGIYPDIPPSLRPWSPIATNVVLVFAPVVTNINVKKLNSLKLGVRTTW